MNGILKSGIKLWGGMIIVLLLSFFLCISINFLCSAVFCEDTGYDVYGTLDGEESVKLYTHDYSQGDDTKLEQYEQQGYTLSTKTNRSDLLGGGYTLFLVLSQVCCATVLFFFLYERLYKMGFKDRNLVNFGHKQKDILKGLKIGLIANIPFFILFILLVLCGIGIMLKDMPTSFYKLLNSQFYSLVEVIAGKNTYASDLNVLQYVLLFLLQLIVPAVSQVSYILGHKGVSLSERFIYVNKERRVK